MKRWIVAAVPLLILSRLSSASAQDLPSTYAVGTSPQALVVGDFDGDGRRDLAVLNCGDSTVDNTVSVLLGNGDGTLQAARDSAAGPGPYYGPGSTSVSILSGDLNGDAKADLIVTVSYGQSTVLVGNGDGTFQPPQPVVLPRQSPSVVNTYFKTAYPAFQQPTAVAVGDVDGDGDLDLVVAARTYVSGSYCEDWIYDYAGECGEWSTVDGYLNVLLGHGDGTFAPAVVEHLGWTLSYLALGDFNGDGRKDLVENGVRLGNGDGTFQTALEPRVSAGQVHDFDRDGRLDMVYAGSVLRGMGDGTFQAAESTPTVGGAGGPEVADVNGDGNLDIVLGLYASTVYGGYVEVYDEWGEVVDYVGYDPVTTRGARVLLGYGDGTFDRTADWDLGTVAAENLFFDYALADFDGDGLPDLAAADFYQGVVAVAHNPGNWPRPSPSFRIDDTTVTEGDAGTTSAIFTVRILAPYDQEVAVDYATQVIPHGSGAIHYADEGEDFVAASGTVRFAPGETSKTIAVEVVGDVRFEYGSEVFRVVLANPTPNASIADGSASGTILDSDTRTEIRIDDVALPEGRSGKTPFVFTVTLSRVSEVPVTVEFYTWDGTAKVSAKKGQSADYVAASGSLTFAPGETSKSVTVDVAGDRKAEPDETFYVTLRWAVNAYIWDSSGLGTIRNDD